MQKSSLSLLGCALLVSCAAAPPDATRPSPGSTAAPAASLAVQPALDLAPPKLRLPDTSYPTRYEAELTLDPAKEGFTGVVSIHLAARRATRIVWMHAEMPQGMRKRAARNGVPPSPHAMLAGRSSSLWCA